MKLLGVFLLALSLLSPLTVYADSRPNIIVIMDDDQPTMGTLSVMPSVNKWIRDQGVQFYHHVTVNPLCCPSRSAFITGQYSQNNGVWDNAGPTSYPALAPTLDNTLPVWLQGVGYQTALIGKVLNNTPDGGMPGWTTYIRLHEGYYAFGIEENGTVEWFQPGDGVYSTDYLAGRAVETIQKFAANGGQPFFMWITPYGPHIQPSEANGANLPIPAARHLGLINPTTIQVPSLWGAYTDTGVSKPKHIQVETGPDVLDNATHQRYFERMEETLMSVDDLVGSVMYTLDQMGLLSNTVVIFTSDNGFSIGHHHHFGKRLPYQEDIGTPLLIRGPGMLQNQVNTQLVSNLDVVKTILDLSGAQPGRIPDGVSLLPLLYGQAIPSWRNTLLLQGIVNPGGDLQWNGMVTDRYKYVSYSTGEEELYYLPDDPGEVTNLAVTQPQRWQSILAILRAELATLRLCKGVTCWVTTP